MRLLVIALLITAGCKDRPTEKPAPEPRPGVPWDAGSGGPSDAAVVPDRGPVAELAGTWKGEMRHDQYGIVRGDVVVDDDGNISYTVQGEGVTHSGVFRIKRWTGSELVVVDQGPRGGTYTVKASLSGPRLELRVDPVGKVVLVKAGGEPVQTP